MTITTNSGDTERLEIVRTRDRLVVKIRGDWRLSDGLVACDIALTGDADGNKPTQIDVDATSLTVWDSAFVCFLVDLQRHGEDAGVAVDLSNIPAGAKRLVDLAFAVPKREGAGRSRPDIGFVESLGRDALNGLRSAGDMIVFLGQTLIAFTRIFSGKARFRLNDVYLQFQQCGPEALAIVTLIAFLVGTILGFVGIVQLQQFGANIYVADLVAVAMVRELGGMMTGIIMAGRTSAAFAAQLGTMNVNEEIAAFRTVGIDPIEFLVLPRMLALIVAVPLLTVFANMVGMLGGSVVTAALSDISLFQYYTQTISAVDLTDWASGLVKATIYGVIIAISGCLRGMQSSQSAAGVGEAATSAVVTSIVFIIVAESILTVIYQVLGI
jgi:phospholipid/cholesterol/gamma-HCH transport system permease protein